MQFEHFDVGLFLNGTEQADTLAVHCHWGSSRFASACENNNKVLVAWM